MTIFFSLTYLGAFRTLPDSMKEAEFGYSIGPGKRKVN
jgi:hypothetical protein